MSAIQLSQEFEDFKAFTQAFTQARQDWVVNGEIKITTGFFSIGLNA
jgi:hypothetical protein